VPPVDRPTAQDALTEEELDRLLELGDGQIVRARGDAEHVGILVDPREDLEGASVDAEEDPVLLGLVEVGGLFFEIAVNGPELGGPLLDLKLELPFLRPQTPGAGADDSHQASQNEGTREQLKPERHPPGRSYDHGD
jgi:hypothetical protein